jgi:two-component system chemotaxis response regulator CheB
MAKKILVIDDSALMRRVISDIINESNEYEVAAIAKDGLEGLDMIVSNPYEYSAVILDINMPKLNGLELLQRLQKDHIEQTVIVVSTVAREGAKETIQALEYGAFDFVTKPENYLETKSVEFKNRIVESRKTSFLIGRFNAARCFNDCGNEKRFVNIDATTSLKSDFHKQTLLS